MSTGLTQSVVKTERPEIQKIVNFIWDSIYHRVTVISCIQSFVYLSSVSAK
jgi:hypothetical protein